MSSEALLKQFTGAQKGGSTAHNGKSYVKNADGTIIVVDENYTPQEGDTDPTIQEIQRSYPNEGGRRRRNTKNSWLSHVKATMKMHRGKSFKQVLKLAKKSYKKSQSSSQSSSQSHSGGRRRKSKVSKNRRQRGGSSVAQNAGAYPN